MNDNTDHYEGALLEEIRDDIKIVLEGQQAMAHIPAAVARLEHDMTEVKGDIKVIKRAVTDQSRDHRDLERRVTRLEETA